MNILDDFEFEGKNLRIIEKGEQVLFVAIDACSILDLNPSEVVNGHKRTRENGSVYYEGGLDEDEKDMVELQTPGGKQDCLAVNEPGLYRLIFKCRKPVAKRFQRWLLHDVVPSIRKTGSYTLPSKVASPLDPLLSLSPEDVFNLPFVPAERRLELPEQPGIYFVVLDIPTDQRILYIGVAGAGTEARNLRERWRNHSRLVEIEVLSRIGLSVNIHWMAVESNKRLRLGIEEALIVRFRPPLNNSPVLRLASDKAQSTKQSLEQSSGSCITIPLPSQEDFLDPAITESWQQFNAILKRTPYLMKMGFTKEQIIEQCWFNPKISPLGKLIHINLHEFANRLWDGFFESC